MLFVLGLSLLVVPALTAQSVNGDRERGVLATLQVTLLSPTEIALGKLFAAWATALVFVVATLPLVLWSMIEGGVALARVAVTLLVVAVLLGVVCAIAQCLSALLARSTTSAVLSYLTVFAATVGTVIAFGLALPLTTVERTVTERVPVWDTPPEKEFIGPDGHAASGRLRSGSAGPVGDADLPDHGTAPRKGLVAARAQPLRNPGRRRPQTPPRFDRNGERLEDPFDPLGEIGRAVRDARDPRREAFAVPIEGRAVPERADRPGPVWPYGLGFDLLLGVGAVALTIRRLRTPVGKLPRAVRLA
jgi:ABC-2 type transport system permease protein